ncbi:MAG TPA: hypothetical protein VNG33_01730 [Polyangiaceae bacterium]|nr:hypothetical protein [Polyangiaceae bacterium]
MRRLKNLAGVVGAVALACLALGCPQGADLEIPANGFPLPAGGASTTGGTATSGTATGGTATGGTTTAGTATGGTATGGSMAGATGSPCEVACVKAVFTGSLASCKLCHSKTPAPDGLQSSGLDLESPNVTSRLRNVLAKHMDIVPPMGKTVMCPSGDKLIDATTPANSWFLKKIHAMQDSSATTTCGTSMPQPPTTLKADELTCLDTYVTCVASTP